MGLETGTYISDLNPANPTSGDPKSQGDDHIRLVKSTIKATFPNVTGAVTVTHTALNTVGLTQPTSSNDTSVASTAYVQNALLNASITGVIPAQTGNAGKFLTTNGTSVSWGDVNTTPFANSTALAQIHAISLSF